MAEEKKLLEKNRCQIARDISKSIAKDECRSAIPTGYELKTKRVTVTKAYRSDIGSYNFDISDGPHDDYLGDRIGAVGMDTLPFLLVLEESGYSEAEMKRVVDDLETVALLKTIELPKSVSVEVDYFVGK